MSAGDDHIQFGCLHCDQVFDQISDWSKHKDIHNSEATHKCEHCAGSFSDIEGHKQNCIIEKP